MPTPTHELAIQVMRQIERLLSNSDNFRSGKTQILVATDVAARGLHIEGVTHVFNVSIPEDPRDYVRRAGRSGRNGSPGTAISIATERERNFIRECEKKANIQIASKDMYRGRIVDAKKSAGRTQ